MTIPTERTSREVRSGRVNRRPPSFAVTLVALVIVFSLAWMFFLRSGPAAPAPDIEGIQGTYAWEPATGSAGWTGTFGAVATGDAGGMAQSAEVTLGGGSPRSAYDAATRTESTQISKGAAITDIRTVGAWPPVWRVATRSPLDYQGLAAVVRTAVEDGDNAVGIKPVQDGDRAAWRAAMTLGDEQITLVVDQETGIVTWCSDADGAFTADVDWASPPPAGTTYATDVPAEAEVKRTTDDTCTYASSPAEAGRTAGFDLLVSDLAPDGYELKAIATTPAGFRHLVWLDIDPGNPSSKPRGTAVLALYTRGLSQFTIEQVGPQTMRSMAGVSRAPGAKTGSLSFEETTLQYGSLKGATASTWYQASGPSLFASTASRAVFVTGALTRQELIAFAEGLRPVPSAH